VYLSIVLPSDKQSTTSHKPNISDKENLRLSETCVAPTYNAGNDTNYEPSKNKSRTRNQLGQTLVKRKKVQECMSRIKAFVFELFLAEKSLMDNLYFVLFYLSLKNYSSDVILPNEVSKE